MPSAPSSGSTHYGVLAFAIARRSRELAVRVAIGATGADLIRLIGGQTGRLVTAGTALGVVASVGLARIARAAGDGSSVFDPRAPAFIIPVLLVAAIGVIATWAPWRRAQLIDPTALLRSN